jgi:uncharacterized protein YbaA (DUF1428 family)
MAYVDGFVVPVPKKQLEAYRRLARKAGKMVVIALIAAIIHYAHLAVPYVHSGFTLLLVGFLVLAAGNLVRGV